jgi:tryptophan synthase alpha chain
VDLPPEEATAVQAACVSRGLDLVYLLAPTSSDERIALVAAQASGFVYCVSLAGVTGARRDLSPRLAEFLARVAPPYRWLGFGISQPEHVEAVAGLARTPPIGSAIIDLIDRTPPTSGRKQWGVREGAQRATPALGLVTPRSVSHLRLQQS